MRGTKPRSTVVRLLTNNPGGRPYNTAEPMPGALDMACPTELDDPVARAEWDRGIVPAIELGQITTADRTLAIAHCELWATWRSQLADASKHAHVIAAGVNKYPMPNPARVMANKTLTLLAKVDAELGLSPTSRTRVQVTGRLAPGNPLDRFLSRGRRRA
jgi:P27 family predicted phage terminase small subunit